MLLDKIEGLLSLGIDVKFSKEINQFKITLEETPLDEGDEKKVKVVVLPFDHLTEERICHYVDLMVSDLKSDGKEEEK